MPLSTIAVGAGAARFNWLPIFAAERLGLLEARGLQLEVVRTGAVDKATAAVRAGDIDIAITPPEGAIADAIAGGSLRLIAGNTNALPLTLVSRPGFETIESLRGARLGTSSLTEGTALYTMEMLRAHGLQYPGDYSFKVVGVHPARWQALQEGRIDAAVQPAPLNFVAIDHGFTDLGEVSAYIPEIVFTAAIVDERRIPGIRPQLVAFLDAVRESTRLIYAGEHDALLAAILEDLGEADSANAQRAVDYMRAKKAFPLDLGIPEKAFETTIRLMIAAGVLAADDAASARSALDLSLLDSLGPEPTGAQQGLG